MEHDLLESEIIEDWMNYNLVRKSGDKKRGNKLLSIWIDKVEKSPAILQDRIVSQIADNVLDNNGVLSNNGTTVSSLKSRIQHPFFSRLLLPMLIKKYHEKSAKHIRWIGQLEQFFYSDKKAAEKLIEETGAKIKFYYAEYFLEKAYKLKPEQETLNTLLSQKWNGLCYTTHELPSFLLGEPQGFIDMFNEFTSYLKYLEESKDKDRYNQQLLAFKAVLEACEAFLLVKSDYQTFEAFLKDKDIVLD